LHQAAIRQIVPEAITDNDIQVLAKSISPEDLQLYYQIALLGRRDLAYSPSPRLGFEMTLLRMLAFQPGEQRTVTTANAENITAAPAPKKAKPAPVKNIATEIVADAANNDLPDWRAMLPKLELAGMSYALAANCILQKIKDNKVTLALSVTHQPMLNPKLKERIEEALTRCFNKPMQLEIVIASKDILTPQKLDQHEQNERLNQAKQTVMQNPKVQKLVAMYDAAVDVSIQN
jgi:DNA polymerase-3 subunit gamma/tau